MMRLKTKIKNTLYRIVTEQRYRRWLGDHEQDMELLADKALRDIESMPRRPCISVIMPVYNSPVAWLEKAVTSVRAQFYPYWQLCIADDCSTEQATRNYLEKIGGDDRIDVVFRRSNGHISAASNSALALAKGEFVCFLDHDDELSPKALYRVAQAIQHNPRAMFFYSDEDKINAAGKRSEPHFKSSWNPELVRSYNYINHLAVYQREQLMKLQGFREGYEGAQDYDLLLRYTDAIEESQIVHLPEVLYHWRKSRSSTAYQKSAKSYTAPAGLRALADHLERCGVAADIEPLAELTNTFRVSYKLIAHPLVTVIIPTRDHSEMLQRCITSVRGKTEYAHVEILVVDNRSTDQKTRAYLAELAESGEGRVISYDREFNYSALNNFAVAQAAGEVICLLNNDTEVITEGWLETMLAHLQQAGVGAVGAQLLYADETLQHAGVILGIGGGAGHSHKYKHGAKWGYMARANTSQNLSAVTAACMMVRKDDYLRVGGLDEVSFSIAFNDVDFCLKLRELGLKIVYTPQAKLYHYESKSRGLDTAPEKVERFAKEKANLIAKWGGLLQNDPYYNPHLSLSREDFSLSRQPRAGVLFR